MSVAVLVPIYRTDFSLDEQVSLSHLNHFLPDAKKIILQPETKNIELPGFKIVNFPSHHFHSVDSYSKLLLSPFFYETFAEYDYILIYQLDCLIFSDQLDYWCSRGYDYIGAPLAVSKTDSSLGFSRVGNGGLSLRKVESFLKVLKSSRYTREKVSYLNDLVNVTLSDLHQMNPFARMSKKIKVLRQTRKGVELYTKNYTLNEDHFWSDRAKIFYPDFKIAPVKEALKFAFEVHPEFCFELNNRQLPFGCHAWARWKRNFWETFLLDG